MRAMSTTRWRVEPVLLVHGGAWDIPDGLRDEHVDGIRAALKAGWAVLSAGLVSLAASVARRLGGRLEAAARAGGGAEVRLILPLEKE